RAAALKADRILADSSQPPAGASDGGAPAATMSDQPLTMTDVQELMWRGVGLFRSHAGLEMALSRLEAAGHGGTDGPAGDLVTVARLMTRAALRREESRGGHFREDFAERDDLHWKVHLVDQHHG